MNLLPNQIQSPTLHKSFVHTPMKNNKYVCIPDVGDETKIVLATLISCVLEAAAAEAVAT